MHEPGLLIAQGRAADVFAYDDGLVLRRYRTDFDSEYEARVMEHVRSHGLPVPKVVEAAGRDLVMERLTGPTMLGDLGAHPWRLFRHADALATLMNRLHEIPPPGWLQPRLGGGPVIVHMDFHPDNIIITPDGPVLIDWSNAGAGHAGAEVADLWLLLSIATIPGDGLAPKMLGYGRKLFLNRVMKHFDKSEVRRYLKAAGEWRLRDRNMSGAERDRIERFVEANAT